MFVCVCAFLGALALGLRAKHQSNKHMAVQIEAKQTTASLDTEGLHHHKTNWSLELWQRLYAQKGQIKDALGFPAMWVLFPSETFTDMQKC